eukprot:2873665-Pyramimonas_sp.AAC.1
MRCREHFTRACTLADPRGRLLEALRTCCRLRRVAARILGRQKCAAGGHHHRQPSDLKPSSSQRALREKPTKSHDSVRFGRLVQLGAG